MYWPLQSNQEFDRYAITGIKLELRIYFGIAKEIPHPLRCLPPCQQDRITQIQINCFKCMQVKHGVAEEGI